MKKCEILVGALYKAKVSGNIVTVRVDAITSRKAWGGREGYSGRPKYVDKAAYEVTNLATGKKLVFKSAQRFIAPGEPTYGELPVSAKTDPKKTAIEAEMNRLLRKSADFAAEGLFAEAQVYEYNARIELEKLRKMSPSSAVMDDQGTFN